MHVVHLRIKTLYVVLYTLPVYNVYCCGVMQYDVVIACMV